MSSKKQTLATYNWQEADPRFAPLPGRSRANHPMAKIIVMKHHEMQKFMVHKELITQHQPQLFAKILRDVGDTNSFTLVEDPKVFLGLLQYAYRGRFWLAETVLNIEVLWDIYIFAEKKDIQPLLDIMMNRITAYYCQTRTFPSMDTIVHVYSQTTLEESESVVQKASVGRRFLARCYVSISINCIFGARCEERSERVAYVLQHTEGLLSDTLNATRGPGGPFGTQWKVDLDPRKVKSCDYHQHGIREKCPNIQETPFNSETDK
ncbi:hypothetical protein SBOR_5710 [Sclerotinia borealis F-4128]|uniref:BTB domain-containing protein n=1 Tax=Sclerotinia borealis (strain F-4128) TaxID=1432307 RepID=W9CGM9_SCLBF|nr:hypothetical protein SBOR_5710 [Sclerotinia borealis F-4128]